MFNMYRATMVVIAVTLLTTGVHGWSPEYDSTITYALGLLLLAGVIGVE